MESYGRNVQEDLAKLADAFFNNLEVEYCEYGAIGIDCKRPFGSSDVTGSILDIIGWEFDESLDWEQNRYTNDLYHEKLIPYLQETWADLKTKAQTAREATIHETLEKLQDSRLYNG